MTSVAAFAELCPGCFNGKGNTSICPRCGYDESLKRGPLILAHHTLLHHGQYLIGKVLGKPGGFGITYLAVDTKLDTRVAIKEYLPRDLAGRDAGHATISPHSEEDGEFFRYGLTQFLQEARTLAQFDHANIVRVRNFFEENGTGYLVMDYYDGITLADYLAQQPQGRLPEKTAVDILMPILDGLREVHAKQFLHRDIKPQNIYLTTANRPILLDFGAARQAMGERSRSLSVVLSEGYAPYEQYHRRGEQGPWTDIYACAAVLYHAVAGEAPPPATERMHKDELEIDALGVSASLAEALRLGLAADHGKRPQRMTEFQALLLAGRKSMGTDTVEIKPKNPDLLALPKNAPLRANESKKNKGPSEWWVFALAVTIVMVMVATSKKDEKKNVPTAVVPVPIATEAKAGPDKVPQPSPAGTITSGSEDAERKAVAERERREAEKMALEMRPGRVFKDCADCPEMVVIPAGSIETGSNSGDLDARPAHSVRIGRALAIAKTEVTQAQWRSVMGSNPSRFSGCDECPVENLSWNDAQEFVRRLSHKTAKSYRLPSEAEWEYACRAGSRQEYCGSDDVDAVAWHKDNSRGRTHPVAGKKPNAWNLYDMTGNAWEWVEDCWDDNHSVVPSDGSARTSGNCDQRGIRGGSWSNYPRSVRAAGRGKNDATYRDDVVGFRLAKVLP